jgi:hypothetical protein
MAEIDAVAGNAVAAGAATTGGKQSRVKPAEFWDRSFYLCMSLLVVAVVIYGFSHTVGENLIHPVSPRPAILYVHATLFTVWLAFFIVQAGLVRTRNVKVHKKLGWLGLLLGGAMPMVGVTTAIVMTRFRVREGHDDFVAFLSVPLFDMLAFTVIFGLAFYWRTRPEFHRRLMLLATCGLTAAGFGRFPKYVLPENWFYVGVDILVLLAVARDLLVNKRVHPVYLYGLPVLMAGQTVATCAYLKSWPLWMHIAQWMLR